MRLTRLLPFALILLALAGNARAGTAAPAWSLTPQPASVRPAGQGFVAVSSGDRVAVVAPGGGQALAVAQRFAGLVASTRGLHLRVVAATGDPSEGIVLRIDPRAKVEGDAGYRIAIGDGRIEVVARAPRGLFYGSVTLWQLLTPDATRDSPARVADGVIVDHPRFAWRGLMLDSARHFQSVADIEKLIDWMSLAKLNVLHWHLTDDQGWRLDIPQYPKLTQVGACRKAVGPDVALTGSSDKPYCGFYTDAEVRRIVAYAAQRYVTIVPEIDMPGHMQAAIAAYPWLGVTGEQPPVGTNWGVNTWLLALDARTLKFVDEVMDHVMALFPSKYIHIGGDEAAKDQWEASPAVRARMHALGLKDMAALQGWFTTQVADYLIRHGRTPVGWDDELLAGGTLPAAEVTMSWHAPEVAVKTVEQGHDVVMATSPTLYFDHYQSGLHDEPAGRPDVESLEDVYNFDPVPNGVTAAQARHVLGLQANLWAEYMPTFARVQHAIFPRIAALSEVAWSPAVAHAWPGFLSRMPAQLARYKALGIAYADSAFAPAFKQTPGDNGRVQVALSNQADFGDIRYTTDGTKPGAAAARYRQPLQLPADRATTVNAATFAPDGFELAAPRAQVVDAAALLTRNSDQLDTCGNQLVLRLNGTRQLADGRWPVYKVDIENTCWLWQAAPLAGVTRIALTVGRLPYNFALWTDSAKVAVRPNTTPAGELQVHLGTCTGPTLAVLPLAPTTRSELPTTLTAALPPTAGDHTLCVFATGDPRAGLWALGKVELLTR